MIPDSFIQDLLARVDIVDIIAKSVPLKKQGANHSACCPFHNEKTPSFTVSQSKQFFHCFGCQANGSAIGFMMDYHGMEFVDAVKALAAEVGMTVPSDSTGADQKKIRQSNRTLLNLMEAATLFYHDSLMANPSALEYIQKRGLSDETLAKFGIGYAPDDWHPLKAIVSNYGGHELLEAGLVIDNENGKRYDRFRHRIMFPILSQGGDIIGFGGRVLGNDTPKYINSPETLLFDKGKELYGLHNAAPSIRKTKTAYVVEGYMDVASLAQAGVENVVATLGTATTPFHIAKLFRIADRIIYCFDGDAAGQGAAWRALDRSLETITDSKSVLFMFMPPSEDPDSFVKEHGPEAFHDLAERAITCASFMLMKLQSMFDTKTLEGRAALTKQAGPLIEKISAPMLRIQVINEVARIAQCSPSDLSAVCSLSPVSLSIPKSDRQSGKKRRNPGDPITPAHEIADLKCQMVSPLRLLLTAFVAHPGLSSLVPDSVLPESEMDAKAILAIRTLSQNGTLPDSATPAMVLEAFRDNDYLPLIRQAANPPTPIISEDLETNRNLVMEALASMQKKDQNEFTDLEAKIDAGTASDEDKARYRELISCLR
jgi:DNA primase